MTSATAERFWSRVTIEGEHLIWRGGIQFNVGDRAARRMHRPHILAWAALNGAPPRHIAWRRLCAVEGCIAPAHITHTGMARPLEVAS